jgi:hypothetical protein
VSLITTSQLRWDVVKKDMSNVCLCILQILELSAASGFKKALA